MSSRFDLGPRPHLGYTQSLIDRVAERRLDAQWLAARATDTRTRTYVIGGESIVLKKGAGLHDPAFTMDEAAALAPITETIFLGLFDGEARFGSGIAPANAETLKARDDLFVIDLRSIAIQGLVYLHLVTVDWNAVQAGAEHVWTDPHGVTLATRAWKVLSANLPFGAAFAAGFGIGFKLG